MTELVVRFDGDDRVGVSGTVHPVDEPREARGFAGWLQLLGLLESAVGEAPVILVPGQDATGKPDIR